MLLPIPSLTPSLAPSTNMTNSNTVNSTESTLIIFGVPCIIIVILTSFVVLLNIYRYYYVEKRPVLPRFEPVMITRLTPPQDSV